jgi:hypothetical protein
VLIFPRFPTALFNVGDEPSVFADPMLLPVVPWLFALLPFVPGAPPVPFTVAPLLSVVPDPEDVPPVEALGEPPAEVPAEPVAAPPTDPPPLPPPLPPPPPLCAPAQTGISNAATSRILHKNEKGMGLSSFTRQRVAIKGVPNLRN